jgi:putative membrane protein insertion efficiency factor
MVQIINSSKQCISQLVCAIIRVMIRCYQWGIAPLLPKTCRFYPSCSEYSLAAVAQFGATKGTWKSLHRLLRCHPWANGGYDPVLPNKEKR